MLLWLLLSAVLHLALVLVFPPKIPFLAAKEFDRLNVLLRPQPDSSKSVLEGPPALQQAANDLVETSAPEASAFIPGNLSPPPEKLIFQTEELDEGVVVLDDPVLEPPYGFADDVHGRLELSILIDERGEVKWIGTGSNAFNDSVVSYLAQAFKRAKFSPPKVSGKPVMTIYRVEITIDERIPYQPYKAPDSR